MPDRHLRPSLRRALRQPAHRPSACPRCRISRCSKPASPRSTPETPNAPLSCSSSPDRTDDQIRAESAYQAAIGGRLDLSCTENARGSFNCTTPYRNAMTDAIGEGGGHHVWPVVVDDGVITQFGFTEHAGLLVDMGIFLASEGRFDGYEDCLAGPFHETCATIQIENPDAWAAWHKASEPSDKVETVVESWFGGDCKTAVALSWGDDTDCSASSSPGQMIAYESILGADVWRETPASLVRGALLECHEQRGWQAALGDHPRVRSHVRLVDGSAG